MSEREKGTSKVPLGLKKEGGVVMARGPTDGDGSIGFPQVGIHYYTRLYIHARLYKYSYSYKILIPPLHLYT